MKRSEISLTLCKDNIIDYIIKHFQSPSLTISDCSEYWQLFHLQSLYYQREIASNYFQNRFNFFIYFARNYIKIYQKF